MQRIRSGPADGPVMARRLGRGGALGLLVLLGGCGGVVSPFSTAADSASTAGGLFGRPWDGNRPEILATSTTVARLRTQADPAELLLPEPGDVWPGPLPPRTTLANPDAALRGVPDYQPAGARNFSDPDIGPAPERPRGPRGAPSAGLPGQLRGSSSLPPPPLTPPDLPQAQAPLPPPAPLAPRPPARADGRIIQTPNGPVVTSGGTDRVQSFTVPGGGTGTAVRDGNNTVLFGPDGRVQTVPNPR